MDKKKIKSALESMMFVTGDPLQIRTAATVLDITDKMAEQCLEELRQQYEEQAGGICIRRVNRGFQLVTNPENEAYIKKMCTPVKIKRLSRAALEVLAIVAYKQPVTKAEIEGIRGVKSDRVLDGLRDKMLVKEKGRSEGIGRPILYGTTDNFLMQFGFSSIKDLPDIYDIDVLTEEKSVFDEYENIGH